MTPDPCSSPIGGISRVSRRWNTYCPHGSREFSWFSSTGRTIALPIASIDPLDDIGDHLDLERSLNRARESAKMSAFEDYTAVQKETIIDRREVGVNRWVFSTKRTFADRYRRLWFDDRRRKSVNFRSDLPPVPGTYANHVPYLILIYVARYRINYKSRLLSFIYTYINSLLVKRTIREC